MKIIWRGITHYWHVADRWLLAFWLFASGASLVFLWGTYNSGLASAGSLLTQGVAIAMGFVAALIISKFDYNFLLQLWKLYLPLALLLVLLTFTGLGVEEGGNRAWLLIKLAGRSFTIQPSEFLKISFVTTLAMHLDKVGEHLNEPLQVLLVCLHGGAHVLLIQTQDSGTAVIFFIMFAVMVFCAGIAWKYVAAAVVAMAAALPVLWLYVLNDVQRMRVMVMLNPELNPDYVFQQARSAAALSTGGMRGTGILAGRHVVVPKVYNDFILAFIGEAGGFMACIGVIILLVGISLKILYNSSIAKDNTGRLVCIGIFAMIIAQTLINVGMCIGILPVVGITLPLFSAGGSSVLSLYCGLGLVLGVYSHSNTTLFTEK